MAAFRLALEQGADGVELDVWRCGTGEVVVHHDPDAGRTGSVPLRLERSSLAELRRLDVGGWKGARYRGERIPLLAEVLEAFPGAIVNVELKSDGGAGAGLARAVAAVLRGARAGERCIVSSFDYFLLAAFRITAPSVASGLLFDAGQWWSARSAIGAHLLRPRAVHPDRALVTAARVRAWKARGLGVNVWTVDSPDEIERLIALGVDAIITNRPSLAREVVSRRGTVAAAPSPPTGRH